MPHAHGDVHAGRVLSCIPSSIQLLYDRLTELETRVMTEKRTEIADEEMEAPHFGGVYTPGTPV